MNVKFANSFDPIPEGNQRELQNSVEHVDPAVDEVRQKRAVRVI